MTLACCSRFQDAKLIANEATTTIWRCFDPTRGKRVVVKIPKTRCEQTEREVALLPRLSHPNIVKLLEVIDTPNGPACVYEEAVGDLLKFVNEGLSEMQVKVVARAVLKATKYLHEHSILHRDIKPENILVESLPVEEKSIVLNDFGLAREELSGVVEDEFCGSPQIA
jgi:calcium/calmodulin-dependent protein kinase-4